MKTTARLLAFATGLLAVQVAIARAPAGATGQCKDGTYTTAANKSDVPIVMKLNGHVARLLHPRDDGWVPYWVDVVLVAPNTTERIAFVADNPGRWLFGGRNLEHLAGGQFGWFEVT